MIETNEMLNEEIEKAMLLRDEAATLLDEMFKDSTSLKQSTEDHERLREKLLDFEKGLIHVEILHFLYSTIARVHLNSYKIEEAIQYAQAGIEANLSKSDQEGVKVNTTVLLDTACMMGAYNEAFKLITNNPAISDPQTKDMIQKRTSESENDATFEKWLKSKKRPSSLAFCLDEDLRHEEEAIKKLMSLMGISRTVALKYKDAADNLLR